MSAVCRKGEIMESFPIKEKKSLQAICYEARIEQRKTAQDIADDSGVPLSTVNNVFASSSKNPSVYTMGAICRSLGVSLDWFFDIMPIGGLAKLQEEIIALKLQHKKEMEQLTATNKMISQQLQHEKEVNWIITANGKKQNRIIMALLVVVILALIYGITLDILNPSMGIFRH